MRVKTHVTKKEIKKLMDLYEETLIKDLREYKQVDLFHQNAFHIIRWASRKIKDNIVNNWLKILREY